MTALSGFSSWSGLVARRHSALLASIVVLFAVRPLIGNSEVAPLVFSIVLLLVLLLALYAIDVDELVGDPTPTSGRSAGAAAA